MHNSGTKVSYPQVSNSFRADFEHNGWGLHLNNYLRLHVCLTFCWCQTLRFPILEIFLLVFFLLYSDSWIMTPFFMNIRPLYHFLSNLYFLAVILIYLFLICSVQNFKKSLEKRSKRGLFFTNHPVRLLSKQTNFWEVIFKIYLLQIPFSSRCV